MQVWVAFLLLLEPSALFEKKPGLVFIFVKAAIVIKPAGCASNRGSFSKGDNLNKAKVHRGP